MLLEISLFIRDDSLNNNKKIIFWTYNLTLYNGVISLELIENTVTPFIKLISNSFKYDHKNLMGDVFSTFMLFVLSGEIHETNSIKCAFSVMVVRLMYE